MLHYSRLGKAEIEGIFRINIDRLQQAEQQQSKAGGGRPLLPVESDILQFASDHCDSPPKGGVWNGRQIRNAFMIAAALARDEAEQQPLELQPQLRSGHFRQVEKLMAEYAMMRARVLGKDDSQQALLNEERDDGYQGMRAEEERARTDIVHGGPALGSRTRVSFATTSSQHQHQHQHAHTHARVHGNYTGEAPGLQAGARNMGFSVLPSLPSYAYNHSSPRSPPPHTQSATSWLDSGGISGMRVPGPGRVPVDSLDWGSDSRSEAQAQN
jgi:hypothetical protein